jgi:hypothetical protein
MIDLMVPPLEGPSITSLLTYLFVPLERTTAAFCHAFTSTCVPPEDNIVEEQIPLVWLLFLR